MNKIYECPYCGANITENYILNKMNYTTEEVKCPMCNGSMICTQWIETIFKKRIRIFKKNKTRK